MSKELCKKFLWMRGCIADSFGLKEDFVSVRPLIFRTPYSATRAIARRLIFFWKLKDRQKYSSIIKLLIQGPKTITTS